MPISEAVTKSISSHASQQPAAVTDDVNQNIQNVDKISSAKSSPQYASEASDVGGFKQKISTVDKRRSVAFSPPVASDLHFAKQKTSIVDKRRSFGFAQGSWSDLRPVRPKFSLLNLKSIGNDIRGSISLEKLKRMDLRGSIDGSDQPNQPFQDDILNLKKQISTQVYEISQLKIELDKRLIPLVIAGSVEELEQQNWILQEELRDTKQESEDILSKLNESVKEMNILKSQRMMGDAVFDSARLLAQWQSKCDSAESILLKSQTEYQQLEFENKKIQSKLDDMLNSVETASEFERVKIGLLKRIFIGDATLTSTALRNTQLKQTINILRNQLISSGMVVPHFDALRHLADYQVKIEILESCNLKLKHEYDEKYILLEESLQDITAERNKLLSFSSGQKEVVLGIKERLTGVEKSMSQSRQDRNSEIEKLKDENSGLLGLVGSLNVEILALNRQVETINLKNAGLNQQFVLNEEVVEMKRQIQNCEELICSKDAEIQQLLIDLGYASSDNAYYCNQVSALYYKIESLEIAVADIKIELDSAKEASAIFQYKTEALKDELDSAHLELRALNLQHEKTKDQCADLKLLLLQKSHDELLTKLEPSKNIETDQLALEEANKSLAPLSTRRVSLDLPSEDFGNIQLSDLTHSLELCKTQLISMTTERDSAISALNENITQSQSAINYLKKLQSVAADDRTRVFEAIKTKVAQASKDSDAKFNALERTYIQACKDLRDMETSIQEKENELKELRSNQLQIDRDSTFVSSLESEIESTFSSFESSLSEEFEKKLAECDFGVITQVREFL